MAAVQHLQTSAPQTEETHHIPVQAIIMFSVIRINIEQKNSFTLVISLERGEIVPNPKDVVS